MICKGKNADRESETIETVNRKLQSALKLGQKSNSVWNRIDHIFLKFIKPKLKEVLGTAMLVFYVPGSPKLESPVVLIKKEGFSPSSISSITLEFSSLLF